MRILTALAILLPISAAADLITLNCECREGACSPQISAVGAYYSTERNPFLLHFHYRKRDLPTPEHHAYPLIVPGSETGTSIDFAIPKGWKLTVDKRLLASGAKFDRPREDSPKGKLIWAPVDQATATYECTMDARESE